MPPSSSSSSFSSSSSSLSLEDKDENEKECGLCGELAEPHDLDERYNLGCFFCHDCWDNELWEEGKFLIFCRVCEKDELYSKAEKIQRCCKCDPKVLENRPSLFYPWSLASFRCHDCVQDQNFAHWRLKKRKQRDLYDAATREWTCPDCAHDIWQVEKKERKEKITLVLNHWHHSPAITEEEISPNFKLLPIELVHKIAKLV